MFEFVFRREKNLKKHQLNIQINKIGNIFTAYIKFKDGLGIEASGNTEQEAINNMWGMYNREINRIK